MPELVRLTGVGSTDIVNLLSDTTAATRDPTVKYEFYTLDAEMLSSEGCSIAFEVTGGFDGANDTTLEIGLTDTDGNSMAIFQSGTVDPVNLSVWVVRGRVYRTGLLTAKAQSSLSGGGLSIGYNASGNIDTKLPITFYVKQGGTDDLAYEAAQLTFWSARGSWARVAK